MFDNLLRNSESKLMQITVRQRLSEKAIISRNSSNNTFEISLTPAPVPITVQKRRYNESDAEHNNMITNIDNSAGRPRLGHNVIIYIDFENR